MTQEHEERLIRLEEQVAHQSVALETLNDVVSKQALTIDRLVGALSQLKNEFLDMQELVDQAPHNQKPPHY